MLWSPGQHYKQTGGKRGTIHEFTRFDRYGFTNCEKLTNWARAKNIKCETTLLFFKSTHLVHPCTPHHSGTPLENSGTPWGVRYTRLTSTGLGGVLLRVRKKSIALVADVEAMFYQIRVCPRDRDCLRFLWWPNGDLTQKATPYRLRVHLFFLS